MAIDFKAIWHDAKVNQTALNGCPGPHAFQVIDPEKKFGAKYRCTRCQGTIDSHAHYWYGLGRDHASLAAPQIKETPA